MSCSVPLSLIAQIQSAAGAQAPARCVVEPLAAIQRFPIISVSELMRRSERERPLGAVSRFNAAVRG
jgi:hypothetical protein